MVFIGAGNVATVLSLVMKKAGFSVVQVFSRSINSAQLLAEKLNCSFTTNMKDIITDACYYIFAVKDDALSDVLTMMPANKGIWIHTSGSLPIDIFKGYTDHYGVLYPLQTISKHHLTNFSKVPLFIEGNSSSVSDAIFAIAEKLSNNVTLMSSDKRKYLHLAAVFACNFSNHLYTIATQILEKQGIEWRLLQPLIDETAKKLYTMHPKEAQTGPAVRNDQDLMELQKSLLDDEQTRNLYTMISENIYSQTIYKNDDD